jgi:hypothetical protein
VPDQAQLPKEDPEEKIREEGSAQMMGTIRVKQQNL